MRRLALPSLLLVVVSMGCSTTQLRRSCHYAALGDALSTEYAINHKGAREANPILKVAPAVGIGVGTWVLDKASAKLQEQGYVKTARFFWAACACVHVGATGWNLRVAW